jgi:transcriptional regulator with PAS, ATPase and Fis domain
MFADIKTKIWELLREKEVSLAMIFSRDGEILWHRGREIKGKTIHEGKGFSKSCLKQGIENQGILEEENVVIASKANELPESATLLNIKSLMIRPINKEFFLYLDSGIKNSFSDKDREVFKILGELLEGSINRIKEKQVDVGGITGNSEAIKRIRELVLKYSIEEDPILLHGETGCGKNHIAELIHHFSGRKGKFVTLNTPGIPENLFESEIFGHKKGAFTDAGADKKGLVEEAQGGTLFFDEIAEVPPSFQARLLRFIETKKYYVLGSTEEKTADVRIVAATNRDLARFIKEKQFREDLYYRLQILEINIPPLRERKEDIMPLVLEEQRYLEGKQLGKGFWRAVNLYDWPGNIRELKSVLKRARILANNPVTGEDIREIINQSSLQRPCTGDDEKTEQIREQIKSGQTFWEAIKKPFLQRDINRDQVRKVVAQGLTEAGGKYVDLLHVFNLQRNEYHRFMAFLSDYKLR